MSRDPHDAETKGVGGSLIDGFGRVATDLRVSVTDRCNFRCRYCMPAEGLPWMSRAELLSFEEIERLTRILVESGRPVDKGHRRRASRAARCPCPGPKDPGHRSSLDISMTTNGFLLAKEAASLADAGLDRVTVSCDSLLKHRFADMTLRDALDEVMEGLIVASEEGLTPIKINTVVIRGKNEDEVVQFAELARSTGYDIRFIEYMPLDAQDEWTAAGVVPGAEIIERIDGRIPPRCGHGRGAGTGHSLPVRRRGAGTSRRDPLGNAAVLRFLQPAPPYRGRSASSLSVLAGGNRPARALARRRGRCGARVPGTGMRGCEMVGPQDRSR